MPSGFLARHPRKSAALAAIAVAALAGVVWLVAGRPSLAEIAGIVRKVVVWCVGTNPVRYVAALAVLPYLGVPVTFIYPVAGIVYGTTMGLVWTAVGLALNLPLGYLIGARWLRAPITRWLERHNWRLPEVPPGEFGTLIVFTRIIPGPPMVVQNLLLAIAGAPFWKYYLYSLPLALIFAAGWLMASGALLNGNATLAIKGICLIVALGLLAHIVKKIHQSRKKP
jgi:uncharacterized membrane protein YdjX (TVP38/TMEM64 family)